MKKDNYEDIEKLFSKSTPLPPELSKENIVQKLNPANQNNKPKKRIFKKIIAAAAAVAVIATGAVSIGNLNSGVPSSKPDKAALAKLSTFSSDEKLSDYYKKVSQNVSGSQNEMYLAPAANKASNDNKSYTIASSSVKQPESSQDIAGFAKTNIQIQGVDEADIIKNDGKYIYIVADGNRLVIVDAATLKVVYSAKLKAESKKDRLEIQEIYVKDNTLVAVCNQFDKSSSPILFAPSCGTQDGLTSKVTEGSANDSEEPSDTTINEPYYTGLVFDPGQTVCVVLDITDRSNPKEVRRLTQDGSVVSTRMVGSFLYTVTNYVSSLTKESEPVLPSVNNEVLGAKNVYVQDKQGNENETIIVTALDTENASAPVGKTGVIGSANNVFCTDGNLYVSENYLGKDRQSTRIHSFKFDKTNVSYFATGAVPGTIGDQYCISEQNGFLIVATNDYNYKKQVDVSSLYVLDKNLKQIANVFDFAKDEMIESVRFVGSTAYVVTFKQTDPLFAIDLSNPKEPKILGEVKLPGFSTYLHPIGDSLILGIGYDGDEEGADYSNVKLSLFDVSDKANPKEVSTKIIKNVSADIGADPKAFLSIGETEFAIPVTSYDDDGNLTCQMLAFEIKDSKLVQKQTYTHSKKTFNSDGYYYTNLFRGTFIENHFYTVDDYSIVKYDLASAKQIDSQSFAKAE